MRAKSRLLLFASYVVAIFALVTTALVATAATGTVERVRFEDDHIRFVEVWVLPGEHRVPAIPYNSVVFTDAAWPKFKEATVYSEGSSSETLSLVSRPGDSNPYPWCQVQSPVPERTVTVAGDFPQHYYRIDYKRIDGLDYGSHWQDWYKEVFGPPTKVLPDLGKSLLNDGKEYSKEWPYDIRYNAVDAAPANHTVRYQDDHLELVEVGVRVGETEHMHGHPYYSIFADDGGMAPPGAEYHNLDLSNSSFKSFGDFTAPMREPIFPKCVAATPQAPHQVTVVKGPPQHFYRVHFKRLDGDKIKTEWRTAYSSSK